MLRGTPHSPGRRQPIQGPMMLPFSAGRAGCSQCHLREAWAVRVPLALHHVYTAAAGVTLTNKPYL